MQAAPRIRSSLGIDLDTNRRKKQTYRAVQSPQNNGLPPRMKGRRSHGPSFWVLVRCRYIGLGYKYDPNQRRESMREDLGLWSSADLHYAMTAWGLPLCWQGRQTLRLKAFVGYGLMVMFSLATKVAPPKRRGSQQKTK